MDQQTTDPAKTQATHRPLNRGSLSLRNWWRNGIACRLAVVASLLIVLTLFSPSWKADVQGAGYTESETTRFTKTVRFFKGFEAKGEGSAFSSSTGWIALFLMLGTLWVLATPRASWGGSRWLPVISGLVVGWIVFLDLREIQREWDAFNARLMTKARVTLPADMQWVIILSILLVVCGLFLVRVPRTVNEVSMDAVKG